MDYENLQDHYVLINNDAFFQFKEIYGARLFEQILKPKANRFMFMSSTILNFDSYCSDIGLDPERTQTLSLESEFDPANRPVYFIPTSKMSYGWNKKENSPIRDRMTNRIKKLAEIYKDDSGVIHTGSFQIAKWLIGELEGNIPHEIITHSQDEGETRDECIEKFTANKGKTPMILISPSVTEGLDLVGDTARFAIFAKVPYPFLGDAWVKRRMDLSDEWYQRQTMIQIIQGGGRVVRGPDDWGDVYILDESFAYLWYKYKQHTPNWWKEAFTKTK
jgi:Rad3-related DNA helicase